MALTRTRYSVLIEEAAAAALVPLDPKLIESVVLKESSGRTDAYRFEPAYWKRYLAPKPEYRGANPHRVSASYGLMQVMYPTAVGRGFVGQPEELFIPETGLHWGCVELARLLQWARAYPGVDKDRALLSALAAYNGGIGGNAPIYPDGPRPLRNEPYAKSVMELYRA